MNHLSFNRALGILSVLSAALSVTACAGLPFGGSDQSSQPPADTTGLGNDLAQMDTARISINGAVIEVWLARSLDEVLNGLMFVTAEQMAPTADGAHRGMLFVFDPPRNLDFWMRNTFIQLDIAFARTDGTIVQTYTMEPLDTALGRHVSGEAVPYALEVSGGVFSELGIEPGQPLTIPDAVLNGSP